MFPLAAAFSFVLPWKIQGKLTIMGYIGFGVQGGHEEMEKTMETTIMGYIRTAIRIHSFIPS